MQIPTLVLPEGVVLTESAAILLYLADRYPEAQLLPADPLRRAVAIQGLVYLVANCYPAVGISDFPERWTTATDPGELERIRAGTRERYYRLWDTFADLFTPDPWLSGACPGILDFMAVTVSHWFSTRTHLQHSRPALHALLLRLDSHPRLAAVVARHWNQSHTPGSTT